MAIGMQFKYWCAMTLGLADWLVLDRTVKRVLGFVKSLQYQPDQYGGVKTPSLEHQQA